MSHQFILLRSIFSREKFLKSFSCLNSNFFSERCKLVEIWLSKNVLPVESSKVWPRELVENASQVNNLVPNPSAAVSAMLALEHAKWNILQWEVVVVIVSDETL
jgi:hypothetical protein